MPWREGRRRFLFGGLGSLALTVPMWARAATRSAGISVRAMGARGDGIRDDTEAFQKAIDTAAATGSWVQVPPGRYLIDPVRSVRLRSRVQLRMASEAALMAKPNAAARAYVLLIEGVEDVLIAGGKIAGERDAHLGRTGEWGHGIMIRGASRITVRDIAISRCWGDGISIGSLAKVGAEGQPSTDILISNVVCRGNRRQGLTIGRSRRVRVMDSEFSDTKGTKPEYGIDIEPDRPGTAEDIVIQRCTLRGNRGGGIQVYHRASAVTIRDCTIENNGFGIYTVDASDGVIAGNTIRGNRRAGVALRGQTRGFRVESNRFHANNQTLKLSGPVRKSPRGHVNLAQEARSNSVSANQYD